MWYYSMDKDGIVISSRVRFARNLDSYKFPVLLDNYDSTLLIKSIPEIFGDKLKLLYMKDMDKTTLNSLVERHIISKEFLNSSKDKAILLNDDCSLSIMVNEEDHLRIQGFAAGNNIKKAYKIAKSAEEEIGKKVAYAKNDKFGYLTACPSNVGSGLRVSVMLHLPALTRLGYISKLLEDASAFGITIRGLYGENTAARGNVYQVSNQHTLGMSDDDIISNVTKIVKSIITQESRARAILMKEDACFEDKIMRSYGILKYARRMDSKEAEKHLSNVRMGIQTGIIKDVDLNKIQKISVNIYPNMLMLECKQSMDEDARDFERANYIRKELE